MIGKKEYNYYLLGNFCYSPILVRIHQCIAPNLRYSRGNKNNHYFFWLKIERYAFLKFKIYDDLINVVNLSCMQLFKSDEYEKLNQIQNIITLKMETKCNGIDCNVL